HVRADRQKLRQVLVNLVSNGIKYNHPGGRVTVSAAPSSDDLLAVDVTDTGMGIAPEDLSCLFVPFERLGADTTGVEGTGLGLAVSKRLVDAMGAYLEVASTVGEGSTFRLLLPIETGSAATEGAQAAGSSGDPEGSRT
ncbi:MAG: ATP-binding protein, partial [Actinomycetota bacterium]|nr:ATP-binding protein [Actinomycetota bacterium]